MDKRLLAKIPFEYATGNDLLSVARVEGKAKFLRIRYLHENEMLSLSIFLDDDLRGGDRLPYGCMYLTRGDYITRINTQSGRIKWRIGRLSAIIRIGLHESIVLLDNESLEALRSFFGNDAATVKDIERNQESILEKRLALRHAAIRSRIDGQMALVPPLPADINAFIHRVLKNRYMFYTYQNKTHLRAFCTECRKAVMIPRPKHNLSILCPECGCEAQAKSRRKYKHAIYDSGCICVPQRVEGGFVLRYFNVNRREHGDGTQEIHFFEDARVIGTDKLRVYQYGRFLSTTEHRWCDADNVFHYYDKNLYSADLSALLRGTKWQYSQADSSLELLQGKADEKSLHHYLAVFEKKPYLEYMLKLGLHHLAQECYHENHRSKTNIVVNTTERSLHKILGIDRASLQTLIRQSGNAHTLQILRALERANKRASDEQVREIQDKMGGLAIDFITSVLPHFSIEKGLRYARRIKDPQVWIDYLRQASELGYILRNDMVMFPKDIDEAHDAAMKAHEIMTNGVYAEAFQQIVEKTKAYEWMPKGAPYIIRTPDSTGDIAIEGHRLRHCVHGYIKRVLDGKCVIAFLRKSDAPDTPFATLEIRDSRIAQVRAYKNEDIDDDADAFVKRYEADIARHLDWTELLAA